MDVISVIRLIATACAVLILDDLNYFCHLEMQEWEEIWFGFQGPGAVSLEFPFQNAGFRVAGNLLLLPAFMQVGNQ